MKLKQRESETDVPEHDAVKIEHDHVSYNKIHINEDPEVSFNRDNIYLFKK